MGDATVGAVGIVNDGDNVGGRSRSGGFDKEDALVLADEDTAAVFVDNAKVVTSALPLLAAHLRTWLQGRGWQRRVGRGQQQWAEAAAILSTMQGQFLTTTEQNNLEN